MRLFNIISACSLLFLGFITKLTANDQYNVILIMTDDQGYGDVSCLGNPYIKTPNLDRLHAQSVTFGNFHVNPFCAPTRAALMTGRPADLAQVRTTINNRNHLNVEETTMAEYFKASGYTTGHFGKWHLGHNYPYRPMDRGFDQWVGHGDGGTGTSSDYWGNDKMNDTYIRNGKWEKFEGFGTDIYFDETMKFIEKNKEKPFFVYLATNVPHRPWNVKPEWRKKYENEFKDMADKDREALIDFYATITKFDENLGELRDFLEEKGLSDNTIVIFLTDNGTSGGNMIFNDHMRGKKGSAYEGGHRVPCFWHMPGQATANTVKDFTAHIDILPTLIDLCNLKTPSKAKFELSGRSMKGLINGDNTKWSDRTIILHQQNGTQQYTKWKNTVVATNEWRLINNKELYQIKKDPSQKHNVADQHSEIVKMLSAKYEENWENIQHGTSPYARPIIGSGMIKETWLTCDGWVPDQIKPLTWDQPHVNAATENYGFWPIKVAQEGKYKIEVRRWPKEIDLPINSVTEAQQNADIYRDGKPVLKKQGIPIKTSKVKLKIGNKYIEQSIDSDATNACFKVKLNKGETDIQAWLIDDQGKKHPAYYVYIIE
ncbi:sulfatase [Puteibacter caeruleilacunae]|nr:sulfatase [Puteibacter caeruleilacunae]